jgi:hypothetical protein
LPIAEANSVIASVAARNFTALSQASLVTTPSVARASSSAPTPCE